MAEPIPQWRLLDAAMQHLDGGLLRVFYALTAFRQAGHAETWPSVANVAERANVSRRQVSRCLRRLEVLGWVTRQHDPHTQATPRYLLSIGGGMTSTCHGGMTSTCHAGGDDIKMSWGDDIGGVRGGMTSRCHPDDQRNTPEEDQYTPTRPRTPAQALTASPEVDGRAGVYEAGPVPEQVPERRPLPIQPVPRLPIAPPPAPPSASEQAMHAALSAPPSQRGNLAAIVAPEPAPRPSQPPVEAVQPMTGERVTLPGDVIDLLEAMGPRALGFARILESNGIADTGALLAVPEAQVKYLRGMGAQRAQQLVEHIAAHWGVLFASEAEATMRIGHALDEHAKRKAEQQQAPQGLRVVAGGRR